MTVVPLQTAKIDQHAKDGLYRELPAKVADALQKSAPLIHHLTGDTSWLFQIPLGDPQSPKGIRWFNILVEPWFTHPFIVGGFAWILRSVQSSLPALGDVNDIGDLCVEVDRLSGIVPPKAIPQKEEDQYYRQRRIDAVMLCVPEKDHVSEPALRQVNPSIPVFCTPEVAAWVKGWKYFDVVHSVPLWSPTRSSPEAAYPLRLPGGLEIHHIGNEKGKAAHFEGVLFVSFPTVPTAPRGRGKRSGWLYNPHGPLPNLVLPVAGEDLDIVAYFANSRTSNTAGMVTNHDNVAVAQAVAKTGARYVVETHMDNQVMSGVISWFINNGKPVEFEDAKETVLGRMTDEAVDRDDASSRLSRQEREARLKRAEGVRLDAGASFVLS